MAPAIPLDSGSGRLIPFRIAMTDRRASTGVFSMRLTPEERARLEHAAAGIPLGSYIRAKVWASRRP